MTRNFSNRRRDDMRPTSRTTSSGRYREEQSSRTSRPRLSRDTVDRAWENGATRRYADYRARPTAPTPQNQRQERPSPRFERSRPSYEQRTYERSTDERRPYEHRQEGYRAPSSFHRSGPPRERRSEEGPRRFNEPGHRAPGNQPRLNSERWTRNTPPRRESGPGQGRYEDERPPRFSRSAPDSFERTGSRTYNPRDRAFEQSGPRRINARTGQGPRDFERPDRARERFAQGRRTASPHPRRDVYNPRWQSRPAAQRDYQRYESSDERSSFRQRRPYAQPEGAQFEGDYEHFALDDELARPERTSEPHVTRLPDGRVLKGSRPAQRRAARFWTEVEDETQALLSHTPALPEQEEPPAPPTAQEVLAPRAPRPARPRKQPASQTGKVKMVKTARADKPKAQTSEGKAGKKKARGGPQKTVIYPSQRGYKWPAAGE